MVGKRKRLLPGRIGETECEVMLDTGASQSAILPRLVEHSQYTGSYVVLEDFRGQAMQAPLAKIEVVANLWQLY